MFHNIARVSLWSVAALVVSLCPVALLAQGDYGTRNACCQACAVEGYGDRLPAEGRLSG